MLNAFQAPTLTDLHDSLTARLVHAKESELDEINAVDVQLHNTMSATPSLKWEFNLKRLWLTPARWTRMIREYLSDQEIREGRQKSTSHAWAFEQWLEKIEDKIGNSDRGVAVFRTNLVQPKGEGKSGKTVRRWGSCMLALSYKAIPKPQITLYSRTSYLGYLSALDLSVAYVAAKYVAHRVDLNVEEIGFVWVNEMLQFHSFKSVAFLLHHTDPAKQTFYHNILLNTNESEIPELTPALEISRKWFQKLIRKDMEGEHYGISNYNTYRRIRRRFHTEVMGYNYAKEFEGYKVKDGKVDKSKFYKAYKPLDNVWATDLHFGKIGLPAPW